MTLLRALACVALSAGLCASAAAFDRQDEGIDCAKPTTTMESDLCASDVAAAADVELNAVYAQARQQLRSPADGGACSWCRNAEQQLVLAQRAWVQLRDPTATRSTCSTPTAPRATARRCAA